MQKNILKEDIAETFHYVLRLNSKNRLEDEVQKIEKAIPNRIKYCLSVFKNNN